MATVVKSDPKAPFSIATTPQCRGGGYFFLWIAPLYPWSVLYNAVLSKESSSTIFWVFGMTQPGIEPRSPGPLANTLTTMPMSGIKNMNIYIYIYIYMMEKFSAYLSNIFIHANLYHHYIINKVFLYLFMALYLLSSKLCSHL